MDWVETTGKTLDEAKEAALLQLGVDASDAEFVVVAEPKAGLFGRMRGEARVRARVRPAQLRPKRTRSRNQGQRRSSRRSSGRERSDSGVVVGEEGSGSGANDPGSTSDIGGPGSAKSNNAGGSSAGTKRRRSRGGRGRGGSRSSSSAGGEATSEANDATTDADDAGAEDRGMTADGAPGTAGNRKADRPLRSGGGERSGADKEDSMAEELTLEQQGDAARRFVEGLVREMGLDAEVTTRIVDADTANVDVAGSELGLLVGPGGATLTAIQELTRTFVQRQTSGRSERIIVDVAGYRVRRAEALRRFTTQIAEEVLSSGEERVLEPMNPPDRKVVHDTVNEIEGLGTRSEGEEPRRFIVISPVTSSPAQEDA
jgi:spoIIIJ-associated protein